MIFVHFEAGAVWPLAVSMLAVYASHSAWPFFTGFFLR